MNLEAAKAFLLDAYELQVGRRPDSDGEFMDWCLEAWGRMRAHIGGAESGGELLGRLSAGQANEFPGLASVSGVQL
jgi:hypothetical protein